MKKFNLLFIIIIFILPVAKAQDPAKFKEHYDYINSHYLPSSFDYSHCYLTGNGLSWSLQGLLNMYKTTGDKGYLIKFINHCIKVQYYRVSIR